MRTMLAAVLVACSAIAFADDYDVVLLRPSSYLAAKPRMNADVHTYMQNTRDILDVAGLRHHTVDEEEALKDGLPTDEFLICAYNPSMPAEVAQAVHALLDGGGHALICYLCEATLRERIGIGELLYTPGGDEDLFRHLQPTGWAPPGIPRQVVQSSWNAYLLASIQEDKAKPVMEWIAADGRTNYGPALVMSPEAAWIGHVMTAGDLSAKAQMLLAVLGRWKPEVWDRAVQHALRPQLGFRYAADLGQLVELAKAGPAEEAATGLARQAEAIAQNASQAKPWEALQQALAVRSRATSVYLQSLPRRPDVMRGAWVVSPRGVGNWGWDKTARVAAENGLTDLVVRIEWGGRANYNSKVLRSRVEDGDDPLAEGIAACHKHGLKYHAWFINLNWRTPVQEIIDEMLAKGLWQVAPDGDARIQEGRDRIYWLNPSEPGVVRLQADMMAEVAANYDVDGVHFDYIRYENYSGSYGPRDRERFEQWAKVKAAKWPEDVLPARGDVEAGPLHERFCDWRVEQISNVVEACSKAVRAAGPSCRISAAVYPSWPYHRKTVGQDWPRWLQEGWIDFICPMTYDTPGRFDRHTDRVRRQREAAADKPLIVGLGSWLHPTALTVAESIVADRDLGADGFLLFSYTPQLGDEMLPALRSGVFAPQ